MIKRFNEAQDAFNAGEEYDESQATVEDFFDNVQEELKTIVGEEVNIDYNILKNSKSVGRLVNMFFTKQQNENMKDAVKQCALKIKEGGYLNKDNKQDIPNRLIGERKIIKFSDYEKY